MSGALRIVVLGAGGLGGYLGALLSRRECEVTLVARGENLSAFRRNGLMVSDSSGDFKVDLNAVDDVADVVGPDIAFVTVKTYALDGVLAQALDLADRGAVLIPLLNGVEAPGRLEAVGIPRGQIAPGVAYLTAFLTGPGRVERVGGHGRLVIGWEGEARPAPLERLAGALRRAEIDTELTTDPALASWKKMLVVCTLTAACGLSGAPVGAVRSHALGRRLLTRAVAEVASVARAREVAVTTRDEERALGILDGFPEGFYPSLVHDLNRGAPTEVDALNGAIVRMGRLAGVATPVHEAATCVIDLKEQGFGPPR